MSDRLANIVIGVVTTGWSANMIAAIFSVNDYHSDPVVNAVFMGTVGLAFVAKFKGKNPPGGDHRAD